MRNQKQTEILQKHIKATIYIESTHILISDSYLKQVERDCTAGNPGRHRGGLRNLTGRKLEPKKVVYVLSILDKEISKFSMKKLFYTYFSVYFCMQIDY